MISNKANALTKLQQNLRELIIEQCSFCRFPQYLETNPEFEFPKITEALLQPDAQGFIPIPGLFGGYTYFLEMLGNEPILYAEQSSRMDYSSDDYLYFKITADGSKILKGKERETVANKFRELSKKAREKRKTETSSPS